jgi:DNA-binding transcriptional regulator YhcF (GntR family)
MSSRYAGVGSNNGKLPHSVREAAEALNIGKSTAARAFESLEQHGFIVATKQGAFSLKKRHATEWRLTEFPCDVTNALASKEFVRWALQKQNTIPAAGPKVPEAGLIGPSHGTEQTEMSRYGT